MLSIVGEATLDEYDLLTLVTEIEQRFYSIPPDVFMRSDGYRRSWRKTQYLSDKFWESWISQYLPMLQSRRKWFDVSSNIKPGDLVLVVDESTKRGHWPKAIVQEVYPDANGLVRRVRVRTADAQNLIRDIRKICLLEGKEVYRTVKMNSDLVPSFYCVGLSDFTNKCVFV